MICVVLTEMAYYSRIILNSFYNPIILIIIVT